MDTITQKQSPIFSKTYDLILWLLNHTEKFPRSERFRTAKRIEDTAFCFYDWLVRAARSADKQPMLEEADRELQRLRFLLRLSHDRNLTSQGQYTHASKLVVEIGKLLGGWIISVTEN